VFAGLAANTLLGAWWLDGVVALAIAGWAVMEGRRSICAGVRRAAPRLVRK
jgi:divalent metal cation (Fe/Co/Zn/Cd) transporter